MDGYGVSALRSLTIEYDEFNHSESVIIDAGSLVTRKNHNYRLSSRVTSIVVLHKIVYID